MPDLTFHSDPLTLREWSLLRRLQRDEQDVDALVDLLVARSGAPADQFLEMRVTQLDALLTDLGESLKRAAILAHLSVNWNEIAHPDAGS